MICSLRSPHPHTPAVFIAAAAGPALTCHQLPIAVRRDDVGAWRAALGDSWWGLRRCGGRVQPYRRLAGNAEPCGAHTMMGEEWRYSQLCVAVFLMSLERGQHIDGYGQHQLCFYYSHGVSAI